LSLNYTPLNHLLASGNRSWKGRWSLLQHLDGGNTGFNVA